MHNYKYSCIYCSYNTNNSQAWYQHNRTIKHKKNEKIYISSNTEITQSNTKVTQSNTNSNTNSNIEKYIYIKNEINEKVTDIDKSVKPINGFEKIDIKYSENNFSENQYLENKNNSPKCKKYRCEYCLREFQHQNSYYRHKKKFCKIINNQNIEIEEIKIKQDDSKKVDKLLEFMEKQQILQVKKDEEQRERDNKLFELLSDKNNQNKKQVEPMDNLREELKELRNLVISSNEKNEYNQTLNNYITTNNSYYEVTNQHNLLNTLNLNYKNVISMDKFLHNMEHEYKIPESDLQAIVYASENMTEGDLAETIHRTIEKNCIEQTRGVIDPEDGQELLPVLPVVCSDGNCRSHKEKVDKFWETVYGDKHFDQMLNVIDKRLYEVLKKKIYLEEHGKKKLFKKIKRKHTIHDMKKIQDFLNGSIIEKPL